MSTKTAFSGKRCRARRVLNSFEVKEVILRGTAVHLWIAVTRSASMLQNLAITDSCWL